MHIRLTAVLLAGLVAFSGSQLPTPRDGAELPGAPYTFPRTDRFDPLAPTQPPGVTTTRQERVTLTTRPIPRPASRAAHVVTTADLDRTGVLVAAYLSAAASVPDSCHLPVALLAAIGQVESGSAGGRQIGTDHVVRPGIFGPLLDGGPFAVIRDTDGGTYDGDGRWDRAVGPMQFIPSTWAWAGVDGDGDGRADPQNVYDAAYSAAGYLCRYGRDLSRPEDLSAAIWAYNQSTDYLVAVLEWMAYFDSNSLEAVGPVGFRVGSGGRASQLPALVSVPATTTTSEPPPSTAATTSPTTTATPTTTTATPTTSTPTTSTPVTSSPTTSSTSACPTSTATETPETPDPTTTTAAPTPTPDPTTTTAGPTTTTATTTTATPDPTASATTCSGGRDRPARDGGGRHRHQQTPATEDSATSTP